MLVSTRTKLPIYRWAQLMGLHPLHFGQVKMPANVNACDGAWFRHNWQDADRVSREEIAEAIARAEADIEAYLSYNLVPDWTVDERVQNPRAYQPELISIASRNLRGYANSIVTNKKHFIAGGIRASTLLEAASAIAWSADKRTGVSTSTVPAGTSQCEIRAYYPGHSGADAFEIRPATVAVAGTTATVTVQREQCVIESAQDALEPTVVDATDDAMFLATLDVYRVYSDPSTQVSFLWEDAGCESELGQYSTQTGVLLARDPKLGVVGYQAADYADGAWTSACLNVNRAPDISRLYYLSGLQDASLSCPRIEMHADWARTVAIYASSMLERSVCGCDASLRIENWRLDLAFRQGAEELATYAMTQDQMANPFGTRRGALYAWRIVNRYNAPVATGTVIA